MEQATLGKQEIIDVLQSVIDRHTGVCPICGQFQWEYYGGRYHYGLRIEYWICPGCCLVVQSPRLRDDYLELFYSHFYRQLYEGHSSPSNDELDFQRKRGRNLLSIFTEITARKKLGRLLDFGCSAGGLLIEAVENFGVQFAAGVELDKEFGDVARGYGFSVFPNLNDIGKNESFDLVTMSHVLEHVPDLGHTLSQVSACLSEDGFLCIEVPHSLGGACFEVTHLWGFNEASITELLYKAGFRVVGMRTHGYPRNPEKPRSYLVVVAQKKRFSGEQKDINPSSPFIERMRRYKEDHSKLTYWGYQAMLARNTLKQLLGLKRGELIGHSWLPSKLKSFGDQKERYIKK